MEKLALVKLQLNKAAERLEAAKYLLAGGHYEDAVSRAYYSMYYAARALLSLKDIYPKAHKRVIFHALKCACTPASSAFGPEGVYLGYTKGKKRARVAPEGIACRGCGERGGLGCGE